MTSNSSTKIVSNISLQILNALNFYRYLYVFLSTSYPKGAETERLCRLGVASHPDEAGRQRPRSKPPLHRAGAGRVDDTGSDGPGQLGSPLRGMDSLGVNSLATR